MTDTTSQAERSNAGAPSGPSPGLLLIYGDARPQLAALPIGDEPLALGRDSMARLAADDKRLSRRHAEVAREGERFSVRDVGSRNGTFVGGERLEGARTVDAGAVVRVGDTLLLTCADVSPYAAASMELTGELVIGPALERVWRAIAHAAATGEGLHLRGETGSGKELGARHFHQASGRGAEPFVAVNCAAIPPAIAERLLFGARKGTYSGAHADTDGYLQAADRGTLFLDEIAELPLEVQGKLLRVLETREVLPLGATRARTVDLRLVTATHRDLRAEVAARRFRDDLYYRIGRPMEVIPPLRERLEDLPWMMRWMLARFDAAFDVNVSFVEAALVRPWPGNVRELESELRSAASAARAQGGKQLRAAHLSATAGQPMKPAKRKPSSIGPEAIVRALDQSGGKIAAAARALGLHRTQLRRLMARHGLITGGARPG